MTPLLRLSIVLLGLLLAPALARAETRVICAYDPGGRSGDYFSMLSKYATQASTWGVTVEVRPYTDEETAAKDYEAGHCDGVVATGVRLQRFNRFSSTMEAIGGLPDYATMKEMVTKTVTSPTAAAMLTQDGNATVGFIPVGAVYVFVRDRSVDSVPELAGKRIAAMDYDKASRFMVDRVGAIMVPSDLGSIGPRFNNGDVDACYVSAPAYRPFELHRGIGTKGGVVRAPIAQATLQIMIREARFPAGFAEKSRAELLGKFDAALAFVKQAEAEIPAASWIDVPAATLGEWDALFQSVRIQLRDQGAYDGRLLKVMRQVRCGRSPSRAECAENKE